MNDLVKNLNARIVWWQSSNRNNREYDVTDCDLDEEVADHIEAQNKTIVEMRTALQQLALNLAAEGAIASRAGQMESLEALSKFALKASKSNPNTPERNEE